LTGILPQEKTMGRLAKSVFIFSFVFLLSLGCFAAKDASDKQVTYSVSLERVFAAETQAFGTAPATSDRGNCEVTYQSTSNMTKLLWTANCKDIGNGQVGVTLTVQGQWFFGVGDEKRRIAKIFWNNMDAILKGTASAGGAPAPSPLVAQPAPTLSQPAPTNPLPSAPEPSTQATSSASNAAVFVQISSEPSGAEILVDGDYTGSTPSQVKLKSGSHSVKITKKGFEPWERSIKVEPGESRNIVADLEKSSQ
jgi:hypothetical protein